MADINKDKLVPQIRFKGYTDAWEQRSLGEVADITKLAGFEFTKYVVYSDCGEIIALRGLNVKNGDLILDDVKYIDLSDFTKLERSKLYEGDILLTYVGTVGQLAVVPKNDKYYLAPNVARIRVDNTVNPAFISQQMGSNDFYDAIIYPLIATSSQPALSMENVRKFEISLPALPEQTAISNFFRTLDTALTLRKRKLDKLKDLKKGYLQRMFPQGSETVPRLRFARFTGDWHIQTLGSITERITRKNTNLESTLPLTISAQHGLIDQTEFFDKQVASRDVSGYFLLKNGEFAYNKSYSNGYPWGAVKRLDRYEMGVLSTLYIVFAPTTVDSEFLLQYYETDNWHTEIAKRAAEGARNHGLLNITPADFFETSLMIPKTEHEQKAIGYFFNKLDAKISAHAIKLEHFKKLKSAYLQKMFI